MACSYVDDITWVKQTVNRRMAKGHGYYLQHAKETCLVGKKVGLFVNHQTQNHTTKELNFEY